MKDIKLNLNNLLNESDIKKYSQEIADISKGIKNKNLPGGEFLGWTSLPHEIDNKVFDEYRRLYQNLITQGVETLIVIGIGGSYLGLRGALDFILGEFPSKTEQGLEIIFAGNSLSSTDLMQKLKYVENKKFAINVISKSGTTIEPAIAFRFFKELLIKKEGNENYKNLIISTTDKAKGALYEISKKSGFNMLVVPDDIGGRFSILTPVGLFPLLCAGVNIEQIITGAKLGVDNYSIDELSKNDAFQYALTRFILYTKKNINVEMLVSYEPYMNYFLEWWKQLFGESEGKNGKSLLPHSAIFSTDLHSLGQTIQDGPKILFETVITIDNPKLDAKIIKLNSEDDLDNLNKISNMSVHDMNNIAFKATAEAHSNEGDVPNIHLEIKDNSEFTFGQLIMFFEYAVAMSSYLLKVNPFDQPGVEVYKTNMKNLLKK